MNKVHTIGILVIFIILLNYFGPMFITFIGGKPYDYINLFLFTNFLALLYIILPNKISLE